MAQSTYKKESQCLAAIAIQNKTTIQIPRRIYLTSYE